MFQKDAIKKGAEICLLGNEFGPHACGKMTVKSVVPIEEANVDQVNRNRDTRLEIGELLVFGTVVAHGDLGQPSVDASVVIKPKSEITVLKQAPA